MTVTDLARFRIDGEAPAPQGVQEATEPGKKVWKDRLGTILAFDQALAKVGWAKLRCTGTERAVMQTGMIKTEATDFKGLEDTLRRTTFLAQHLRTLLDPNPLGAAVFSVDVVGHEMPPVGAKMRRGDSSLVAACAVRIVADEQFLPVVMLNRQHVYKELGLGRQASKREVSDFVRSIFPDLTKVVGPLNEDTFDAIALALVIAEGDWLGGSQ